GRRRRVARRGADDGARAGLERLRDRHGHPAVLERTRRIEALALQVDLRARVGGLGQPGRGHERRVALEERDDRCFVRDREKVPIFFDHPAPRLHAGLPSTRIIVVAAATSRSRSIFASAVRMSRSRASWVSITTGTASRVPRPFWMTLAIEMSFSPTMAATRER